MRARPWSCRAGPPTGRGRRCLRPMPPNAGPGQSPAASPHLGGGKNSPLPLAGGGGGRGETPANGAGRTPSPNPLPQGEGENFLRPGSSSEMCECRRAGPADPIIDARSGGRMHQSGEPRQRTADHPAVRQIDPHRVIVEPHGLSRNVHATLFRFHCDAHSPASEDPTAKATVLRLLSEFDIKFDRNSSQKKNSYRIKKVLAQTKGTY